jgi:3-methyl-2-oxobutanoate hydroxymethyltransferase
MYRNFAPELERLQSERIAAFKEFKADVDQGGYPGAEHSVAIQDDEFDAFMKKVQD